MDHNGADIRQNLEEQPPGDGRSVIIDHTFS